MARRKTQNLWCPHPLPDTAGASRRATCAQVGQRPVAHAISRRLVGGGPRFLGRHALARSLGAQQRAQVGRRPVAHEQVTASSWRGLVVVPGGAPMPPECFTACEARGRRTPSRRHDASRERPFKWTRWSEFTRGFWGGDKFFRLVPIADALIYSDN